LIEERHLRNAISAMKILAGTNIKFHSKKEIIESSFELAVKENLSVYDTVYIALAGKLKIPLLTTDKKQMEAAKKNKIKIADISDFQ